MNSTTLTLGADARRLLPLVGRWLRVASTRSRRSPKDEARQWSTSVVEPARVSGIEQADLVLGDLIGEVLLRRDEPLRSALDGDGMLHVEMQGWAPQLEPESP